MTLSASQTSAASLSPAPMSFNQTSFVGNTPSTVLFFLAMAVAVLIALLFVFFTLRYFVRSRYGLHVYPLLSRGMMFSSAFTDTGIFSYTPLNREIHEHLDYLRTHHFLRDEFLERRRHRRRRGRFAKMKKLQPAEVELLFPPKRYADWLSEGTPADPKDVLQNLDASLKEEVDILNMEVLLEELKTRLTSGEPETPALEASASVPKPLLAESGIELSNLAHHEPHFDLGTCAICLEVFGGDDIVRGLVCGHVFHAACVDPWLIQRRACCPICKRDYYKEVHEREAHLQASRTGESRDAGDQGNDPDPDIDIVAAHVAGRENSASPVAGASQVSSSNAPNASSPPAGDLENSNDAAGSSQDDPLRRVVEANEANEAPADTDDLETLNYDFLRSDPNLRALLTELIPLSERVRVLLEEHPQLDLEARARATADHKYRLALRKIFWHLMGISKTDLFNWAVILLFQQSQAQAENGQEGQEMQERHEHERNEEERHEERHEQNIQEQERQQEPQQERQCSGRQDAHDRQENAREDAHERLMARADSEIDVSEAVLRETVERRV